MTAEEYRELLKVFLETQRGVTLERLRAAIPNVDDETVGLDEDSAA